MGHFAEFCNWTINASLMARGCQVAPVRQIPVQEVSTVIARSPIERSLIGRCPPVANCSSSFLSKINSFIRFLSIVAALLAIADGHPTSLQGSCAYPQVSSCLAVATSHRNFPRHDLNSVALSIAPYEDTASLCGFCSRTVACHQSSG